MNAKFLLFCIILPVSLFAQNLVPNPSFESYDNCPTLISQIGYPSAPAISVAQWYKATQSTSDYFNSCAALYTDVSVPANLLGNQYARTGNGYAGIFCYFGDYFYDETSPDWSYREYLQTKLITGLIAGHRYFTNYWISLAEKAEGSSVTGTDQIGIYFAADSIELIYDMLALDSLTPQVESPVGEIYTDTLNWTNVSGLYTAMGGERWIILGNFHLNNELNLIDVIDKGTGSVYKYGYYYYEDVCLIDVESTPVLITTHDTLLCDQTSIALEGWNGSAFEWDNGDNTKQRNVTTTGIYWVRSLDPNNCAIVVDTFKVGYKDALALNIGNDTMVCPNIPLTISVTDTAFNSFTWNTGERTRAISVVAPGNYYVTASNACYVASDTIQVEEIPLPKVDLPPDTMLCEGIPVSLKSDNDGMNYLWNTGSKECCIVVNESGSYSLTVGNICGAQASDTTEINYSKCNNCFTIPNAFSPNNDGLNDQFKITISCNLVQYKLNIFNRWGQLVFTTIQTDEYWDGNFQGVPVDVGTYFYSIEAKPAIKDLKEIFLKGDLTLIR